MHRNRPMPSLDPEGQPFASACTCVAEAFRQGYTLEMILQVVGSHPLPDVAETAQAYSALLGMAETPERLNV